VKTDVTKAFDTIKQRKLFDIVQGVFTDDVYYVHFYSQSYAMKQQLRSAYDVVLMRVEVLSC